jgi:aldehyde dehydrogenase (NAD+)
MAANGKVIEVAAPNGVKCSIRTQCFINNQFVDAESGKTFETVNPATEEVIAHVASGDKVDVDKAVKAARAAFEGPWSQVTGAERGRLLNRLADLVEKYADELVAIEVMDNGKPANEYKAADLPLIVSHLRYYAGWADKITGETFNLPNQLVYTRKEPIGVAGQIIPWNFPLLMFAWKIGPALAAGCTVVVKPAEQTPLGALRMGDLVVEAGFPPGVINIVPGFGETAGAAISNHMDIDKVAFTGSVEVGKLVMKAAADSNLKKVTLELGGKSPFVVFEDADLDVTVATSHQAIFLNQGQVCTAASRVFVQESIYEKFIEKAKEAAVKRVDGLGDPFSPTTLQGAQVSEEQHNRIMSYIDVGKKEGARLVCGGERHGPKGYFIKPTIFADVRPGMKIHDEEIFGPVQTVIPFKDLNDAVFQSNHTVFGLGAAVHSRDISKAFQVAHRIRAGTVWVNTYHQYHESVPFGGYKQSGIGREKGYDALLNYLETKSVYVNLQ